MFRCMRTFSFSQAGFEALAILSKRAFLLLAVAFEIRVPSVMRLTLQLWKKD